MSGIGTDFEYISRRIRACDYLSVAQIYLKDNFLLNRPLHKIDIKPRLLGHWGTCHGINFAYSNLKYFYGNNPDFEFILGPGHGFPALQANLFIDQELLKVNEKLDHTLEGVSYLCKNFSWPDGFPSHSSPSTPGVICEGGELGYALAMAYGRALGNPNKIIYVLIGDGEFETATTLASLNLNHILSSPKNGRVIPILHLNGYKISGPTVVARKPKRELLELVRGFGYNPIWVNENSFSFQYALNNSLKAPFLILETPKGQTGPTKPEDSHQVPLKDPKNNPDELSQLENWLKSYHFEKLFNQNKGFTLW